MNTNINSVVIVRNPHGYTATVRFKDDMQDECLCAATRWGIYERVEKLLYRRCRDELKRGW